jgi:hypothetical protein
MIEIVAASRDIQMICCGAMGPGNLENDLIRRQRTGGRGDPKSFIKDRDAGNHGEAIFDNAIDLMLV